MYKVLVLIKARPDISPAEFRRYYEERHVPLVLQLLPMIRRYRRNYLDPRPPGVDFDAVTEVEFDDEAAFDLFRAKMADSDEGQRIRADSAQFLQSGTTTVVPVHTCTSPPRT